MNGGDSADVIYDPDPPATPRPKHSFPGHFMKDYDDCLAASARLSDQHIRNALGELALLLGGSTA
jgi:hypothetical protein